MRLILKDYLLHLKEKDELDLLLCDLLLQMGYTTDNRPTTGNRQYGVDIRAHTDSELLLCIVKQGNLTRKIWDSDPNAVRQSLDEIQDCYMGLIQGEDRKKQLKIVVATNGMLDEAVRSNWEGYVRKQTVWDGMPVSITLWNIDTLVAYAQRYLFDERVFDEKLQSLLRRSLYFVDESTYSRGYFEEIVSAYLDGIKETDTGNQRKKKLAGLRLASQMIAQYAADAQIYKIAVSVSEYLLIKYWDHLRSCKRFEEGKSAEWIHLFFADYLRWSEHYYNAVAPFCEQKNGIPAFHPVEQRVLIYEVLGYLTSYAYALSFGIDKNTEDKCRKVADSIILLLNNHPQYCYPAYDCDVIVVSMLYRLLLRLGKERDVHAMMEAQCQTLIYYYQMYKKYPTSTDSFEDAVNIHMGFPAEPYESSAFWGTMLLWVNLLKESEIYPRIQQFLTKDLNTVTPCTWFLRSGNEEALYTPHTMYTTGEGAAVETLPTFEEFQNRTTFLMKQYSEEKFSFDEYGFPAMEFIVARYFGTLPRVRLEDKKIWKYQ